MRRIFYFLLLTILLPLCGKGQIFGNEITGSDPSDDNPYIIGQYLDPNVSASGIGRGPGVANNNGDNRYNGKNWDSPVLDNSDYFEFTISPNSGYKLNFSSFDYTAQASGTGPTTFSFRSSLDAFTTEIASPTNTGGSIDLSDPSFQNITTSITFRLYGWGASSSVGTFSVNDFQFLGSVPLPIELISFSGKEKNGQVL
ncbi:MAG: hypothetical protein KDC24_06610 [Saprospiraceae bacterium]|nr:hypothetical protein [Saprospiraceae bacterium]